MSYVSKPLLYVSRYNGTKFKKNMYLIFLCKADMPPFKKIEVIEKYL